MADDCQNTISTPDLPDFQAAIRPFLKTRKTRFTRMQNCINYETHDDWEDIILPTGVAQLKRTIDLDFQRIIPMPEPIKRTEEEEFSQDCPRGIALREAYTLRRPPPEHSGIGLFSSNYGICCLSK
jgi:hypothetical protein